MPLEGFRRPVAVYGEPDLVVTVHVRGQQMLRRFTLSHCSTEGSLPTPRSRGDETPTEQRHIGSSFERAIADVVGHHRHGCVHVATHPEQSEDLVEDR